MDKRPDRELVALARSGDREAFGQLVTRYQRMAAVIATRIVRDEDIAEEMAQEAMLKAYLSLKRLRDDTSFKSWLHGIVRHVCMSHLRDRRQMPIPVYDAVEGVQIGSGYFLRAPLDPQAIAEKRELHHRLLDAVNALSQKNRETALLFYYEQQSLQEITFRLGISLAAAKNRLHRARKHLLEILSPVYAEWVHGALHELRRRTMVDVTIADVMQRDEGVAFVVLLDGPGHRMLAIQVDPRVGLAVREAIDGDNHSDAIATNARSPAQETDFVANLLDKAGVRIQEVRIETLDEKILLGVAKVQSRDTVHEVEARPSDVLALAARTGCPIRLDEEVLIEAGEKIPEELWEHPETMFPGQKMLCNAVLTKSHVRAMENLHNGLSPSLAAIFSDATARKTNVAIAFVDCCTYAEYAEHIGKGRDCAYRFTVGGMKGKAMLSISLPLAHVLLDSPQAGKDPLTGEQTDRLESIARGILKDLEATWKPVLPVTIQDVELTTDLESAGIAAPQSLVYLVAFEVDPKSKERSGLITLCYPNTTIFESALPPLVRPIPMEELG